MRHVNEQCVEDAYPLPRTEDMLVQQGAREIHSALDLQDAFHQIPLAESSRYITCTATPRGIFQWRVVVMRWKNGVQYCQRNVEVALEEVRHLARGYVDDILIGTNRDYAGNTEEDLIRQHFRETRSVLLQLGRYDLIASLKKAQFFVKEVEFCGHLFAGGKRHPAKGS